MFCRNDSLRFLKTTWLYDPSSLCIQNIPKTTDVYLFILSWIHLSCFCAFLHVFTIKIFWRKNSAFCSLEIAHAHFAILLRLYTPLPITHSLMNSGLVASGALLFTFVITANHHTTIPSRWPHLLPRPNWIASFYDCIPKHVFVHLFVYIRKLLAFFCKFNSLT